MIDVVAFDVVASALSLMPRSPCALAMLLTALASDLYLFVCFFSLSFAVSPALRSTELNLLLCLKDKELLYMYTGRDGMI
jgi:hypothetical protein